MNADEAVYVDSSALVKLVVEETESQALISYLRDHPVRVSCALARVEVIRAVGPHGQRAVARARQLLERVDLLRLDDVLLDGAANLEGEGLRSLDAIHVAAALALGESLKELVTYDLRMVDVALSAGLVPRSPA